LHLFAVNVCYKSREEKKYKSNLENEGARLWVSIFVSNDQETPCLKGYEQDGRSGVGPCPGTLYVRESIQTFPDRPPGARTANGTPLCH
jgi:hypothetical protein